MAPAKKTTSLRQGTLSFASSKPTAATTSAKLKNTNSVTVAAPTSSKKRAVESSSEDSDEIESSSTSPPPAKAEGKVHTSAQKSTRQTSKSSAETRAEPVPTSVFKSKDATENSRAGKAVEEASRPELNPKDRKYNKHYTLVRDKMGHMLPIHGEGQTKIHEILRVFDLSDQYGPCVGVTRIERWERASMLGLNPPQEVYDILSTKQGATESQYIENVFYDQV
ncbi:uncharacterized protein LACBIDRAFT_305169 [Laccaria bicolor S238N-H82]|uniref:Predicted protein n=1 Tax=Laccaria bicolor (strain S238N-H82 / ATCC MYA-4686) TaxID=486041 RepID=B0CTL0_LACBS|nr:uncharacterized protein LACBIDRAFT_305169 [Laccaria bicolor S238N-H82]EDR14510.1 predicted protein [Laccaria bicolor S238N-H82]|eukprot:XP_001875069.1 predicted protein [Laccaria bicolor S238N-H82]